MILTRISKRLLVGTVALGATATGGTIVVDNSINPYTEHEMHYELPIVSQFPQNERVEIHKDKAQMDLIGWNDEYKISIIPQIPTAQLGATDRPFIVEANRPLLSKKMEYRNGDITAFIEPKEGTENEFDIDFTLQSKPDTNVFEYKIEGANDFDFFYQPELTPEEIAEGASRPENVVGSYAVYHKTKVSHQIGSTNYATGKVYHIYRPKAIDANGVEQWSEISYVDGVLTVTVPQKFLDDAVYPVRVDPTFGYTSVGGTTRNLTSTGHIHTAAFSLSEDGNVSSISVYRYKTSLGTSNIKGLIYEDDDADDYPEPLLTEAQPVEVNTTPAWATSTFSVPASLASGTYFLASVHETASTTVRYDTDTIFSYERAGSYNPVSDPFPISGTNLNRKYSIYATYTASAAASSNSNYRLFWEE